MKPAMAEKRFGRTAARALFVCAAVALLAATAYFVSIGRAARREIASLEPQRDRLQAMVDRLQTAREQAEDDKRMIVNVLGHCREAADIPDLQGDRVVAHQGQDNVCFYVPAGSHTLEILGSWKPTAPRGSSQASQIDALDAGEKTWSVPLVPACGYFLKLMADRRRAPVRWELASNHPDFATRKEMLPVNEFSQRGASWSSTNVLQWPNQIEHFAMSELSALATRPPGTTLMKMSWHGVCQEQEQPCEISFTVRLTSDAPACVSASTAQRLIILGHEALLQPYAGGGKYAIRIPDGSKPKPSQ